MFIHLLWYSRGTVSPRNCLCMIYLAVVLLFSPILETFNCSEILFVHSHPLSILFYKFRILCNFAV